MSCVPCDLSTCKFANIVLFTYTNTIEYWTESLNNRKRNGASSWICGQWVSMWDSQLSGVCYCFCNLDTLIFTQKPRSSNMSIILWTNSHLLLYGLNCSTTISIRIRYFQLLPGVLEKTCFHHKFCLHSYRFVESKNTQVRDIAVDPNFDRYKCNIPCDALMCIHIDFNCIFNRLSRVKE